MLNRPYGSILFVPNTFNMDTIYNCCACQYLHSRMPKCDLSLDYFSFLKSYALVGDKIEENTLKRPGVFLTHHIQMLPFVRITFFIVVVFCSEMDFVVWSQNYVLLNQGHSRLD